MHGHTCISMKIIQRTLLAVHGTVAMFSQCVSDMLLSAVSSKRSYRVSKIQATFIFQIAP